MNPCEQHKNVKATDYCPVCLIEERDVLLSLSKALLNAVKPGPWTNAIISVAQDKLSQFGIEKGE